MKMLELLSRALRGDKVSANVFFTFAETGLLSLIQQDFTRTDTKRLSLTGGWQRLPLTNYDFLVHDESNTYAISNLMLKTYTGLDNSGLSFMVESIKLGTTKEPYLDYLKDTNFSYYVSSQLTAINCQAAVRILFICGKCGSPKAYDLIVALAEFGST